MPPAGQLDMRAEQRVAVRGRPGGAVGPVPLVLPGRRRQVEQRPGPGPGTGYPPIASRASWAWNVSTVSLSRRSEPAIRPAPASSCSSASASARPSSGCGEISTKVRSPSCTAAVTAGPTRAGWRRLTAQYAASHSGVARGSS